MKVPPRLLILLIAAVVSGSCSSVRPMTEGTQLQGRSAQRLAVVLDRPFSFKHHFSTYTLPAGRYLPMLQDDRGVYFVAPSKITKPAILGDPFIFDGGLYLLTDGSRGADAYVTIRNQPHFIGLPADFHYELDLRANDR
jgi:hypothetical protein